MPHRYSPLLNFRPISAYSSQKDYRSPAVDMLRYPPISLDRPWDVNKNEGQRYCHLRGSTPCCLIEEFLFLI